MHKGAIIGIIVAVVAVGGFLVSPLFYETVVWRYMESMEDMK